MVIEAIQPLKPSLRSGDIGLKKFGMSDKIDISRETAWKVDWALIVAASG